MKETEKEIDMEPEVFKKMILNFLDDLYTHVVFATNDENAYEKYGAEKVKESISIVKGYIEHESEE